MSLAVINSRAAKGIQAPPVSIEVHLAKGLPSLGIVGLPEKVVKESKDRVRSAVINCDFEFPVKRIVVNLAPADLPKEGGRFDLPIALGILAASSQINQQTLNQYEIAGELALTGELRPIKGVIPFAVAARKNKRKLIIPAQNANEAALTGDIEIYPAHDLLEVCAHINGVKNIKPHQIVSQHLQQPNYPDLKDIVGQEHGKRALKIAAAGGHSLLLIGPPGTGKTMLASRLPGILPPMSINEALEVAAIYSVSNVDIKKMAWRVRPFRAPHHTSSSIALVGGGRPPKPGEISLAHIGVLFLDELPEFSRHVLEALREPLEAGTITISRASYQAQFPASFQLIAAMNPCPCGFYGDSSGRCRCTYEQVQRYQSRLSGPLLDRIDMHVEIPPLAKGLLLQGNNNNSESSAIVQKQMIKARGKQLYRNGKSNAQLVGEEVLQLCKLTKEDNLFLEDAMEKLGLSARAFHRVLKLARTIADLDDSDAIERLHLQEALSLRKLERISA